MRSDTELLEAWRAGDREAGAALFERHYDAVARFFLNKLGDEADDLIQRTFLECTRSVERYRGLSSFRTYLFAIANHLLKNHLRGRSRAPRTEAWTSVQALHGSPSQALALRQEQRLLLEGLRRLPLVTQTILELHYWEQLGTREIGEVLDMPAGTVKTRLQRGRAELAAILAGLTDSAALLASTTGDLEGWAGDLRRRWLGAGR